MIADGRVSINGNIINSPVNFVSDSDIVTVDGKQVSDKSETELYAFYFQ